MVDQTVTTTSANGLQTTIQSYVTQNGALALTGANSTATSEPSAGVSVVTQTQTSTNGALISEVVTTTTDTAASETVETQSDDTGAANNGAPVFDTTTTDATVYNSDNGVVDPGWITETITTTSTNGTSEGQQIIVTSADRSTVTTTTLNGDGQTVEVDTNYTAPTGVNIDTLADYNPDGSLRDETVTTTSANGLDITTQYDPNGATSNGSPVFFTTTTDDSVVNADSSVTETITTNSSNGALLRQEQIWTSANGLETISSSRVGGGPIWETTTTDNTTLNSDGSSTELITVTHANGSTQSQEQIWTSGNGLDKTTYVDLNGAGIWDSVITDDTVLDGDGSTTETITTTDADGSLQSSSTIWTSVDGRSSTTTTDSNGLGQTTQTDQLVTNADNSQTETVTNYAYDGLVISQTVTWTSANGLDVTSYDDPAGSGFWFQYTTDDSVLQKHAERMIVMV